jgi:quaternary ammonium compound-resistance protein SugE
MAWLYLLLAGFFEIVWAGAMKYTHGFTRLWPSALVLAAMAASVVFMAMAVRVIPLGTAYAIWCGIGILGTTIAGIMLFGESADPMRLACIALIGAGVIGLKVVTP